MAELIASVFARSPAQVRRDARRAAMLGADWLELRLDSWPAAQDLSSVLRDVALPVLVACRTREDGGEYRGTLTARRELLAHALRAGAAGVDLEQWETWSPPSGQTRLQLRVRSFHSFTGVPKDLDRLRDELAAPGTVAKIAVTAHDLADAAPVLELLASTDQRVHPTTAFAMGRACWPTRVLAAAMGAPLVYGALDPSEPTAPGQPSVADLAGIFRVKALSARTKLFGLLGNPAAHSLGPWLHNRAMRRLGVDGVYLPFESSRPESVLRMLPIDRVGGLSVTSPFKERMVDACVHVSDRAATVGAVNTLLPEEGGGFVGDNTDVLGVSEALRAAGADGRAGQAAVVLGAGGAGRAAAVALLELGYDVTLLARSLESVRPFARAHGVTLGSLSEQVLAALAPAVLVHATPVGAVGPLEGDRVLPGYAPAPGVVVHDLVYRPTWTRLLRECAGAGAKVVPGVEMFLAQARAQVRLFTGEDVAAETLRGFLAGSVAAPGAPAPGAAR
ncbi:MAG: type I 3-dehydroquinate dehydratase [Planctomycetota bacterium]